MTAGFIKTNWPPPKSEIRSLTGLRGCAAVLVMLYHFTLEIPNQSGAVRQFLQNGYLWVDLFFILSGFVMAYSQAAIFSKGYKVSLHLSFLVGRLARIYPLYAVVIIGTACSIYWRSDRPDLLASLSVLGLNLALVQSWFYTPSLEGAAWSISTEWAAYLLFPLLLAVTLLSKRWLAWLSVAVVSLTIIALALYSGPVSYADQSRSGPLDLYSARTLAPLVRCLAEFTLGLAVFRVARVDAFRKWSWSGPATLLVTVTLLIALCQPGCDVFVVGLYCALLVLLTAQTGFVSQTLSASIPYALGRWSYSIYLLHDKFRHSCDALRNWLSNQIPFGGLVAVVLTSGAAIGCSALTYMLIERPLRRLVSHAYLRTKSRSTSLVLPPELIASPTTHLGSGD